MKKLNLEEIDSFDIEEYTQDTIKNIDDSVRKAFTVDPEELDESLVNVVECIGELTNRLYKEKMLLSYYKNCFAHIKEKLLVKYKYGAIRDLDRIDSMIETSLDWQKYDGMVFSQNLICEHIEMRIKAIKNQTFNIKDIIDIKKLESA